MRTFSGTFFSGLQAVPVSVELETGEGGIAICDALGKRTLRRDQIVADAPVPGLCRLLRTSDGELIETDNDEAVEALWPTRNLTARVAFALESRWWAVVGSLGLTAGIVWVIVAYLLPLAADPVSRLINPKFERILGQQSLATLDRIGFKPTELSEQKQKALASNFRLFIAGEPGEEQYRLEFRKAPVANAFALPGDIIVVTDEMVNTVKGYDEFFAVVAHEIGHIHGHHAMRMVLQDSVLAVLMTALAGDAVGTTVIAAALPSVLLRSRYSRQFETEADEYAFAMLRRHEVSPRVFADVLRRLQTEESGAQDTTMLRYLSSHPGTEERIRRADEQR
ncbi:MAG TPA: M48 family metallopeptidase [Casimicrobiaceae bacterium]|jgi:predicted Zn-dependent protease